MYSYKTLGPRQPLNKNVFMYNVVRYIKIFGEVELKTVARNKQKVMLTTTNCGLEEFPRERKRPCEGEKHPEMILGSDTSGPTVKKGSCWNRAVISYWSGFFSSFSWLQLAITRQSIRDLVERAASRGASKPTPELHLERERDPIVIPPNLRKHIRT